MNKGKVSKVFAEMESLENKYYKVRVKFNIHLIFPTYVHNIIPQMKQTSKIYFLLTTTIFIFLFN